MSGCLIGDYVIGQRKERDGSLPADGAFIRSIVSTNMADAIADYYGIELVEVLTGFKFIGQKILEFEKALFEYVDTKYPEVPEAIRAEKVISDETEAKLVKAIEECKADFLK